MLQIKCHFNHSGACSLLNNMVDCTCCHFYKTSERFYADYNKAAAMLHNKGLTPHIYYDVDNVKRMGVIPIPGGEKK